LWKRNKKPINCVEKQKEYMKVQINPKATDNFKGIEFLGTNFTKLFKKSDNKSNYWCLMAKYVS